jgi:proteic killer suppression protein
MFFRMPTCARHLPDRLDSAVKPEDMNLPGFWFHRLSGKLKGAFVVSGNWRITFRFADADAIDVNLEDYH